MKNVALTLIGLICCIKATSQQENPVLPGSETEQQLENITEQQQGEPEDDSYLQTLVQYRRSKLNLNVVDESDLKELKFLSPVKIEAFLGYRRVLGNLVSIYELQAVPGWDVATIRKILPYVRVADVTPVFVDLKQRLAKGRYSTLLRFQQVLEKSEGFLRPDSMPIRYPGTPAKVFFRYKYNFQNQLQYGITADKDAGEQFFKGSQKAGFDFYSAHFFARKLGAIKAVALGDFTVNMGQGLIQWQSLAFKKSADVTAVKRQSEVLRPYNSSGEYNFMRGAGVTVGVKNVSFTAFASLHKLDGTFNDDTSQSNIDYVSSILNSGYHRTATEVAKKNAITQTAFGGNISYGKNSFHVGINGVAFKFSVPLVRNILPYNQFAIQGKEWFNYSIDYSYTYRNFHLFGEGAMDKNNSKAFVGGMLASLGERVDAAVVYRNIGKSYQSLYGNAFTEGTSPTNENGLFTGISIRPVAYLRLDAYADVFSFPWLRYRVDAPTHGSEYLLQVSYQPNKQVEMYSRFKNERKAINLSGTDLATRQPYTRPRDSWRTHLSYVVNRQVALNQRVEMMWFDPQEKNRSEQGFLIYADASYKPFKRPLAFNARLQYFETDGFDSRVYAFESDVLYSYSIPQFMGKGLRYYINLNWDIGEKTSVWFRWAQTIYANQHSIGSGLDKIDGNKRSEVKLQVMHSL